MPKFEKGQSGNLKGRPIGTSRNSELRKKLHSRSDELIDSVIDAAIEGDMTAMKMCLDRILPTLKPQESNSVILTFDSEIPPVDTNKKISDQFDTSKLTVPQLHNLLALTKLKTELSEVENKDNSSIEKKQWDKILKI